MSFFILIIEFNPELIHKINFKLVKSNFCGYSMSGLKRVEYITKVIVLFLDNNYQINLYITSKNTIHFSLLSLQPHMKAVY